MINVAVALLGLSFCLQSILLLRLTRRVKDLEIFNDVLYEVIKNKEVLVDEGTYLL